MKYFITIILFTLFSISNSEIIDFNSSVQEVTHEELISLSFSEVEFEDNSSQNIKYSDFITAKESAVKEDKYIMIKVEADNCPPCERLNALLESNENIKEMVNRHIKSVNINSSYDSLPEGLHSIGTPTVFLIKPNEDNKVVMKLVGNEAIEDLEEALKSFVSDSYEAGLASL
ncbi:thioredoxin family protein [Sulfurovum sp. bin170]|uniref:thioredoxin family protein n=1 Tax=Sulfurovum sp. bin170 TaxID=2695268 RepID=UPI0013DFCBCE|nr:thioredoxin family protein [Sulfurovum sp. bin170]NEW59805.1 thioredoxin family protein [Sulfurovum sp. bin170]